MARKVTDDTLTTDVVWSAAKRIGKSSNPHDINRICEYLISTHWFQTAGDLRAARANAQAWLSLEVPSRLKIAIQEVLDMSLDYSETPLVHSESSDGYDSSSLGMPLETSHLTSSAKSVAASDATTVDLSVTEAPSYEYQSYDTAPSHEHNNGEPYAHSTCSAYDSTSSEQYDASYSTGDQDDATAAAAHTAAWEAYYAANGYYSYEGTQETSTEAWNNSYSYTVEADEDVVEAQEVIVEDAVVATTEQTMGVPVHLCPTEVVCASTETWSCGQCTYINRIEDSFCEICCGHYSLSSGGQATTREDVSAGMDAIVEQSNVFNLETTFSLLSIEPHSSDTNTLIPMSSVVPPSIAIEPPLYVSIPSPSKPLSPLHSPSAPEFDASSAPEELCKKAHDLPCSIVSDNGKATEIFAPVPTSVVTQIDYRALAFNQPPMMVAPSCISPPQSSTEFSF